MPIICATDFSESAEPAEAQAIQLAQALRTELVYLHVSVEARLYGEGPFTMADVQRVYDAQRQWATETLSARVTAAKDRGVMARMSLRVGTPHVEIVKAARDDKADMIVMGTHGRTGLERLLLGSVAERVIRLAPCPVLTVRPHDGR
ncbi:MAG: universal stress protein [Candidatus Rokubacteria bacterium]|nr:universal stress protein [Candidatus Rokubacteria bacterium]